MLDAKPAGGRTSRATLLPSLMVPVVASVGLLPTLASAQSYGAPYPSPYQQGPTRPFDGSSRSGVYSAQPAPKYDQTPRRLGGSYVEPSLPPIWNGLYLGVQAGYGWQSTKFDSALVPDVSQANGRLGGYIGYNWQFDNIVLGAEADMMRIGSTAGASSGSASALMETGWQSSLRARAGISVGQSLVFATAGFASNDQKVSATTAGSTLTTNDLRYGTVVGGGVETILGPRISARIEALHYDFGSSGSTLGGIRQTDNVLRAGLTFKLF